MNKNAVIFAAWVPDINRIFPYLVGIAEHFNDCDIYVGLNPSQNDAFDTLVKVGIKNIIRVSDLLVVNSDASAYQAALLLFKTANQKYETVHFLHTKGISHHNQLWQSYVNDYFLSYCRKKVEIDTILATDQTIGGVSFVGRTDVMDGGYSDDIGKYLDIEQHPVENTMSLLTFYSIRGTIVDKFLEHCKSEFYTQKLDRYFFETSFPLIVDKLGYKRHFLIRW